MLQQQREFVIEIYQDIKNSMAGFIKTRDEKRREANAKKSSKPFEPGRDPQSIQNVVNHLVTNRRWDKNIAEVALYDHWIEIVGANVAQRTEVLTINDGVIVVRAQTQTWTTELRRLKSQILHTINEHYPQAEIADIKILPPHTVNWKKGSLAIAGRGPRDTYDWA